MSASRARACALCGARAVLVRPGSGAAQCRACFLSSFEAEVARAVEGGRLFRRGEHVAVGASGGKDSAVLAAVLAKLNAARGWGLRLTLLSVDEGIAGYRDASLAAVRAAAVAARLPLAVLGYADLYGWSMDAIVAAAGRRSSCTFCGVFRRQALDRGARALDCDVLATGHNADDAAETVLMNLLRGDVARLRRCAAATTGGGGGGGGGGDAQPPAPRINGALPRRVKPFKHAYEKDIVLYAYHAGIPYFSTECVYAPDAYRGHARELIKELEVANPAAILGLVHSAEAWHQADSAASEGGVAAAVTCACSAGGGACAGACACTSGGGGAATGADAGASASAASPPPRALQARCVRCDYMTSTPGGLCQACNLLAGLNAGVPRRGLTATTSAPDALAPVPHAHVAASGVARADVVFGVLLPGGEPEVPTSRPAAATLQW